MFIVNVVEKVISSTLSLCNEDYFWVYYCNKGIIPVIQNGSLNLHLVKTRL